MTRLPRILAAMVAAWVFLLSGGAVAAIAPPVLIVTFSGATMPLNGVTTITYILLNLNDADQITGVNFNNVLPAGLVVAGPADSADPPTNNCNNGGTAGTLTANVGSNTISYSGATIKPGVDPKGNCVITVSVKATSVGAKNLSVRGHSDQGDTYFFTEADGLLNSATPASIIVLGPATVQKAFGAPSIVLNHTTTLTITLSNPNGVALTGVAIADPLFDGLIVATPPNVGNTCGGTVVAGDGAPPAIAPIVMTGGTIAANASCTITVTVQGTTPGIKHNLTTPTFSANGGNGTVNATADLLVIAPPLAFKQFFDPVHTSDPTTPLNGQIPLVLVALNLNETVALTGVQFTDTLPAGLVLADPPFAPELSTCDNGGTPGTLTAVAGSNTITYTGATIAPGAAPNFSKCQVVVFVTGTTPGDKLNTFSVSATQTGPGEPASAGVLVVAPPTVTKSFASAFDPPSLALNASTTLTFTLSNANRVDLVDVVVGDVFPDGLVVATPNAAVNACGGTLTADDGGVGVVLNGATIPANGSCTFSVSVTGTTAGTKDNTTTAPSSSNGGTGVPAVATLYVVAPPVIAKAFPVASIIHGDTTTLSFTIVNPPENTIPVTGVGFTDILPPGIMIADPNGLTGSCFNGTITAPAFTRLVTLSGASIPVNSSCTFSIRVIGTAQDTENVNVSSTVTSANGGDGNTATATLKVVPRIIPTLQEWALVLLAAMLALSAVVALRRREGR